MSSKFTLKQFLFRAPKASHPPAGNIDLPITTGGEGTLIVPIAQDPETDRQRDFWRATGQKLARQEDWQRLGNKIEEADSKARRITDGTCVAELLADGARVDVVGAFQHMLTHFHEDPDAPLMGGIQALEQELADVPDSYGVAATVALAHIDIAWLWRGLHASAQVSPDNQTACDAHLDRAREIMVPFCNQRPASALCCLVQAKLAASPDGGATPELVNAYQAYFARNPESTGNLRSFGIAMLPRWHGSYARLEHQARHSGNALTSIWGAGSYTWIMMDAISEDIEALAGLDVEYFIEGIRDILDRSGDQTVVNLFAAYCAVTMSQDSGNDAADFNRARLHNCRNWIIRNHLREVHPKIWARAVGGFDVEQQVKCAERFEKSGLTEARRVLKSLFLRELARGQNVSFTDRGPIAELPRHGRASGLI